VGTEREIRKLSETLLVQQCDPDCDMTAGTMKLHEAFTGRYQMGYFSKTSHDVL
jgi:hypothetical protein